MQVNLSRPKDLASTFTSLVLLIVRVKVLRTLDLTNFYKILGHRHIHLRFLLFDFEDFYSSRTIVQKFHQYLFQYLIFIEFYSMTSPI